MWNIRSYMLLHDAAGVVRTKYLTIKNEASRTAARCMNEAMEDRVDYSFDTTGSDGLVMPYTKDEFAFAQSVAYDITVL
jgi:hypothetical protein